MAASEKENNQIPTNDPKFSDRQVWANSADPRLLLDEQFDQGLHCLLFHLHILEALLYGRTC